MAIKVIVTDRKYFYQHSNGDSFAINPTNYSNHLSGLVFEKLKAQFTVEVSWNVILIDYQFINQGGGNIIIIKEGANFVSNGFAVGDTIIITFGAPVNETGEITYVSESELRIKDYSAGSASGLYSGPDWFKGTNQL